MGSLPQPAPLVPVEVDLSRFSEAAWIIDLDQARVIAASRSGLAIWGGAWREGTSLDRAMPAFAELNRLATTRGSDDGDMQLGGAEKEQRLLVWTTQGIVRLRCRCQPLAQDARKVLVVAADGAQEIDSDRPANNSSPVSDRGRAMLAHELRTPLSAIVALAEVMKDERFGPVCNERYLVYANDIYESARHALSVLGAMLEGGGSESTARQPAQTDVNETVSRCLSALRELAGKASVRLVADLGPDQRRLAIERRSLMQILLNLISNALKFTYPGGEITVATRGQPDGGLVLSVADTGAGMAGDQLERIRSGEFVSAGIGSPRSGYGLPIVAALARGSGGRMEIDSVPGQGTRVSITFPSDRLVGVGPTPA